MTLSEIRAQFITANAELRKLQDMIEINYFAEDVLDDMRIYVSSAAEEMANAKEYLVDIIKSHDNDFQPLPDADEE